MELKVESDGRLTAVKTVPDLQLGKRIELEATIHKTMNHLLVVRYFTELNHNPAITTEFAVNGSLRNHLSDDNNPDFSLLKHATQIAKIIAGIALVMRNVHSKSVISRNLTPENILLDWDWNVLIANFGCSTLTGKSCISPFIDPDGIALGDAYYLAPECYDNTDRPANDVFSFGFISVRTNS
jgi:serine/threonine protein kinase